MSSQQQHEPIAIIGSGCRFPGEASSPSKLWELLHHPRDVLSTLGPNRFNAAGFYHEDSSHHGTSNIRHSYLLSEDHRTFDAQFFNVKPIEADTIDPQQRILLEVVYEALEAGGQKMHKLQGSDTAVYVGVMSADYSDMQTRDLDSVPTYFSTGNSRSILSNRISYFFDWHGPCMTIDTACSSSLVALDSAVQALRSGNSRMALAAEQYIAESKLKMLSPTGRSSMWSAEANGYARGDGFAAVVLKTLSAALEDGDHIESIIRATGVNQDGKTNGITMPSRTAQAALIHETYKKVGLNPLCETDRCQYFEAHGTGTPAGDPIEAGAIAKAFFGKGRFHKDDTLFVGSIKTIVGHTEGTAGLAGILKASLALQHSIIPPNMHFNSLSASVEPFYKHLKILTAPQAWPLVKDGQPRRASVNSFGFGGTNAHAILDSYENPLSSAEIAVVTPFVVSAGSEKSLYAAIAALSEYLKNTENVNLRALSHTLSRRTVLRFRVAFAASSAQELYTELDEKLEAAADKADATFGARAQVKSTRVLGVFTGQGAQWASMARGLIECSSFVRERIAYLSQSLAELPVSDRPPWSLKDELVADAESSHINQAVFSQPLCTAVQIVLVDLLSAAGVKLEAVVGHSSGEIGAAYAAGLISAYDAIRIAYYRGFHSGLACGAAGGKGAMLAVGTSIPDAKELCALEDFEGRLSVAACNSNSSVTLSGDMDAVNEAKEIFEEEKKFARLLKVEVAYHSHHMLPCAGPYIESLQACGIKPLEPAGDAPSWYSSVSGGELMENSDELKAVYWKDNMVNTVLFTQAIENAVALKGPYDMAIEIGPHPALQGPASQTIQELTGSSIPYAGVLRRGKPDVESVAEALGSVWTFLGDSTLDFAAFDQLLTRATKPPLLKGLPSYQWNHEQIYWSESRTSIGFRTRSEPPHELLGSRTNDNTEQEYRWRNLLRPKEVPWLEGHRLQGQMVVPAAGYIAMALEAALKISDQQPIKMIDVCDLSIGRPITFNNESSEVETLFTVSEIEKSKSGFGASFSCGAALKKDSTILSVVASGKLNVFWGEHDSKLLPARPTQIPNLFDVEVDTFYADLARLGYNYTGSFQGLVSPKRKLGIATGAITNPASDSPNPETALLVHPGLIDIGFQSVFLAHSAPNDGGLYSLHVPNLIKRIRINPGLCREVADQSMDLKFDSSAHSTDSTTIEGDVNIYSADGNNTIIQIEGCCVVPFSAPKAAEDRLLFSQLVLGSATPYATSGPNDNTSDQISADVCERVAFFYLRTLHEHVLPAERERAIANHQQLLHLADEAKSSKYTYTLQDWFNDTQNDIDDLLKNHSESVELKLIQIIGASLPTAIREQSNIALEPALLAQYSSKALGVAQQYLPMVKTLQQIAHVHPHINILEIGAGTDQIARQVIATLDTAFASYTYTDSDSDSLDRVRTDFDGYSRKAIFKQMKLEDDLQSQKFSPHSFDVIISVAKLCTITEQQKALSNARELLRPGGYLITLEPTNKGLLRLPLILGALDRWPSAENGGQRTSPCLSVTQWNSLLKTSGFSGVDSVATSQDYVTCPYSIIVSQAIDNRVKLLRKPLVSQLDVPALVVVGGQTLATSQLIEDVNDLLSMKCENITTIEDFEDFKSSALPAMSSVLVLSDLDEPIFKNMSNDKLDSMKALFDQSRNVVWVTRGCNAAEPYANMMIGLGRTVKVEMPHLRLQFLDLDPTEKPSARPIVEAFLRHYASDTLDKDGTLGEVLWYNEPELSIRNGQTLIPRIILDKEMNDRYNSSRRQITRIVDTTHSAVSISLWDSSYVLQARSLDHIASNVKIHVQQSMLKSIKTAAGYAYLVVGTDLETHRHVLALSNINASIVSVPSHHVVDITNPNDWSEERLVHLSAHSLADAILNSTAGTVLVHEPEPALKHALLHGKSDQKRVYVSSYVKSATSHPREIYLHPLESDRNKKALLPKDVAIFLDFANDKLSMDVEKCLPSYCQRRTSTSLIGNTADVQLDLDLKDFLTAAANAMTSIERATCAVHTMTPSGVVDAPTMCSETVITWTQESEVKVKVEPIDKTIKFRGNVTYILLGLSGLLGQSLAYWMTERGAKHFVLTSRNPVVDPIWTASMEKVGANVRVMANDITDKDSVYSLIHEVRETMPQIAGIVNGAMILTDGPFVNVTMESMDKGLKAKVNGTTFFNDLFSENTLDFFVSLCSLANAVGNSGQTVYGAANSFMTAMTTQRRQRGLAASAIDMGPLIGIGYLSRMSLTQVLEYLYKSGFMFCSEREFHHMFAEAVMASPANSGLNHEIITGVRTLSSEEEIKGPWFFDPRMQHFVRQAEGVQNGAGFAKTRVSVKAQLANATCPDETKTIVRGKSKNIHALVSQLQNMLKMSVSGNGDQSSLLEMHADELGLDSLIAVELRSWFLGELQIDMPVLKILGGATIGELLEDAVSRLPEDLLPSATSIAEPAKTESQPTKPSLVAPVPESAKLTLTADPLEPVKIKTTAPNSAPLTKQSLQLITADHAPSPSLSGESDSEQSYIVTSGTETPFSLLSSSSSSLDLSVSRAVEVKRALPINVKPMSLGQARFWFLNTYLEDRSTSNIVTSYRIRGKLRVDEFAKAVTAVGQRHEALRTRFFQDEQHRPMQEVLTVSPLSLEHEQIRSEADFETEFEALKGNVYNLEQGAIMRIRLLSQSPTLHLLLVGYNHINMDGVSLQILMSDIGKLYTHQPLPTGICQFPAYTERRQAQIANGEMKPELLFWHKEFPDLPQPLPLFPMSRFGTRQTLKRYEVDHIGVPIDAEVDKAIKETCRRYKVSPFHFYLAVLRVMIFRFLDTEDTCIGISDANRLDGDVLGSIGMFLNLLPLRFQANRLQSFGDALKEAKMKAYSAMANSRLPFDILLKELDVPRSSSYSPLFQVFMDYRQGSVEKHPLGECEIEGIKGESGRTGYDLVLDIIDNVAGHGYVMFKTQKSLYTHEATELIAKTYTHLLKTFATNPAVRVDRPLLYDVKDARESLEYGQGPLMESRWAPTVVHQIHNMVLHHSDEPAIKDGTGKTLTYHEMSSRASQIQAVLVEIQVKTGDRVAVFQYPSADWICSILAIFNIGAVYVPLDTRHPVPRLASIVTDSKPKAILCHTANMEDAEHLGLTSGSLIDISGLDRQHVLQNTILANPDMPAIILYTSGSTGTPKGIVLKHSNLRHQMEGLVRNFGLGQEKVLQQTAFSFDMSVDQIIVALCAGGMLYVVSREQRADPAEVAHIIASEGITYTKATPSEYANWVRYGSHHLVGNKSWKAAWGGGEMLTEGTKQDFRALNLPQLGLFNCYGPSEVTVACAKMQIDYNQKSDDSIPVGYPLPNYSIYILDEKMQPVPLGVPGEIVVGGAGVSCGYLNNEKLTLAKYLPDPFVPPEFTARGWTTMYRTGDKGCLRPDKSLLFLGRIDGDTQIKLRGLRIELGDIESSILQASHGVIDRVVVSVRGDPQFLVAHVVFSVKHDYVGDSDNFLQQLLKRLPLPQYMCPSYIAALESMPLTPHFKVDRKAIAALPLTSNAKAQVAKFEMTATEQHLKQVWHDTIPNDIAGLFEIEPTSDFFSVGGNSILLVRLQALVREQFDVALPLMDMFEASTLSKMSAKIEQSATVQTINWEKETALNPADFDTNNSSVTSQSSKDGGKVVLLTGATGYLGSRLLHQLDSDSRVSHIHCVALRPTQSNDRKLPLESDKITYHTGNLESPELGLTKDIFTSLASNLDVIIHSGAKRSFWDSYHLLRKVNVGSTKTLVNMASARQIPIHFVSSGSGLESFEESAAITDQKTGNQKQPPTDGSNGYVASKWASEKYLANAAAKLGLPVTIHRFAPATHVSQPSESLITELVKLANAAEAMPAADGWSGTMDFVHTETMISNTIGGALTERIGNAADGQMDVMQHQSHIKVDAITMGHMMKQKMTKELNKMPALEWMGEIKKLGFGYIIASHDINMGKTADGHEVVSKR